MKVLDAYRLFITPLTPVHIGSGESYEPTNYVIEDSVLYEFDTAAAIAVFTPADRQALLEICDRKPDTNMILAVQRFFYEHRTRLLAHAVQRVPILPGVASLYATRVGKTAQREANGKKVINRLEIDRTGYNLATRQPLLFGSSLKGAIRTALLDGVNAGQPAQERKGLHEFQGRLFRYYDKNARPPMQLERDPMRLVRLSDAVWAGADGLPATQVYLAVNRKKAPVKDEQGRLRRSQAEAKDLYQLLECVPGGFYRAFCGQLTIQSVAGLDGRHNAKLPATDLRFDIQRIAHACNAFYRPILEAELRQLRARGYLDQKWDETMQSLLQSAEEKFVRGEAFFLRVGRHSGAESVTLNGVRHIKIMKGKNEQPEYLKAPKTWWLAAEEKDQMQNLLPFGWLLIEVHPLHGEVAEWDALKQACMPYLERVRRLAKSLHAKAAEIEAARREEEERRRAAEAERQRQAEEAERKAAEEAARQARLAAMSENLKRVEAFKEAMHRRALELRGRKVKPHGEEYNQARALAQAALSSDWTPEEKRAVAEAIIEWLPKVVQVDLKEERKKLKLRELLGEG